MRYFTLVLLCLFISISNAIAATVDDGIAAIDKKDYQSAYSILLPL
jgi:hypothetical protein